MRRDAPGHAMRGIDPSHGIVCAPRGASPVPQSPAKALDAPHCIRNRAAKHSPRHLSFSCSRLALKRKHSHRHPPLAASPRRLPSPPHWNYTCFPLLRKALIVINTS